MREQLTDYMQQLQCRSTARGWGEEGEGGEGGGEEEEEPLIQLPSNFQELLAAAEADAIHESERRL